MCAVAEDLFLLSYIWRVGVLAELVLGLPLADAGVELFGYLRKPLESVELDAVCNAPPFEGCKIGHRYRPVSFSNQVRRAVFLLPYGARHIPRLLPGILLPPVG